jgi:hypothetical protein
LSIQKTSYFYSNLATMTKMRLTAFPLAIIALVVTLASCRRDDVEHQNTWQKNGIVLSSAQENNPANTSSATGTMDVNYSRLSRTLSYTINWTGLTGPVTAMHIHGLAPSGFNAAVFQTFSTSSIVKCSSTGTTACGTYRGTLLIDGVAIKEADLINGMYYVNIHTAAFAGGEIRGQIKFQ